MEAHLRLYSSISALLSWLPLSLCRCWCATKSTVAFCFVAGAATKSQSLARASCGVSSNEMGSGFLFYTYFSKQAFRTRTTLTPTTFSFRARVAVVDLRTGSVSAEISNFRHLLSGTHFCLPTLSADGILPVTFSVVAASQLGSTYFRGLSFKTSMVVLAFLGYAANNYQCVYERMISPLSSLFFSRLCFRHFIPNLILLTLSKTRLIFITQANRKIGVSDQVVAVSDFALRALVLPLVRTRQLEYVTDAAPHGDRELALSLFWSARAAGGVVSGALSAALIDVFGIQLESFSNLTWLAVACATAVLLPLTLLPMVGNDDDVGRNRKGNIGDGGCLALLCCCIGGSGASGEAYRGDRNDEHEEHGDDLLFSDKVKDGDDEDDDHSSAAWFILSALLGLSVLVGSVVFATAKVMTHGVGAAKAASDV